MSMFRGTVEQVPRQPLVGVMLKFERTDSREAKSESMRNVVRKHIALAIWFFGAVVLVTLPPSLRAQNPSGSLLVTVQDSSGARVAGASVSLTQEKFAISRAGKTDAQGETRFESLQPGSYTIAVNASGFAEKTAAVIVAVSSQPVLVVTVHPQSVRESVEVRDRGPSLASQPIETTSSTIKTVITSSDLDEVPLSARSFANISYLAPFTAPVEPSDPTKARITAVSFGGSSGLNVDLSVDGGDNTDDYIGGFLQNFSADAIQEFAVRTSDEEADTGRTVGGSVVITTKHGTNLWHGGGAFYERASALNARFPIDNPPPQPKQPFSRQNYLATLGGPIRRDMVWVFGSFEAVHEGASVNYSPNSLSEFNALASLASMGLIHGFNSDGRALGVDSIAVPTSVKVPFRNYMGSVRLDWAQSNRSQWFLRGSLDNYTTNNNLLQQATLPSTGTTSGSKYTNIVLNNQMTFSPIWLGSFTFDASFLHHTESRNQNLGFALAFPFSSTFSTISGFETFGDNQFQTPITAFPVLRDQEKYQFRYDLSHVVGTHTAKVGVSLIHEPVLSGALSGTAESLLQYANDPSFYLIHPGTFTFDPSCAAVPSDVTCTETPAGNGSFRQRVQRLGLYAQDSWRVNSHFTVNHGLRWDTTFGLFDASGRSQSQNPAFLTLEALQVPLISGAPHDYRRQFGPRLGIAYSPGHLENTVLRASFGLYYNDLAQNGWVSAFQAVNAAPGPCTNPAKDPGLLNPSNA